MPEPLPLPVRGICLCVCNQGAYVDNLANAVNQILRYICMQEISAYRKFPNRGAGRVGKPLGGALIKERAISPSSGFLQIENRTIFG